MRDNGRRRGNSSRVSDRPRPGEFGLVRPAGLDPPTPGFHLVFPGSLRGWPTTPARRRRLVADTTSSGA